MNKYIPQKDELLTIAFQNEIHAFFDDKKKKLGFDFFGMAERSPYGSMFASSDPRVAHLLYDNNWYSSDPAINRENLKLDAEGISHDSHQSLYQSILVAKQQQCDQAGNFTVSLMLGETELYFCIAAKSYGQLTHLKKYSAPELSNIGIEFREFMHTLASPAFDENNKFRESYCYYIFNNLAYEGKETLQSAISTSKHVEMVRFNYRIKQLFRITNDHFVGFTSDLLEAREAKLSGKHVEELVIVANPLFRDFENNRFSYSRILNVETKKNDIDVRAFLHKDKRTWVTLTPQQYKCFTLLIEGHPTKKIAILLNLSTRTVENYLQHIREILGCRNSKEIISAYYAQATISRQMEMTPNLT